MLIEEIDGVPPSAHPIAPHLTKIGFQAERWALPVTESELNVLYSFLRLLHFAAIILWVGGGFSLPVIADVRRTLALGSEHGPPPSRPPRDHDAIGRAIRGRGTAHGCGAHSSPRRIQRCVRAGSMLPLF